MFGYQTYSVIERLGVVGIIVRWEGNKALVMFEDGKAGTDNAWYPLCDIARFKVVG